MAAPSVRVLGANNPGIKPIAAKTGTTNAVANTGNIKKASVKTTGVSQTQTVSSNTTTGRVGTAAAGAGRLPVITTKTYKPIGSTPGTSGASNTKITELSDKLDGLQLSLDEKANLTDLENYYTKPEIDEMKLDYYTAEEVDEKISGLNNLVLENGDSLNGMIERIEQNESAISEINTTLDSLGTQINSISGDVNVNTANITLIKDQLDQINESIADINTITTVQEVRRLRERVHGYQVQLEEIMEASQMIYDAGTDTYKLVRIVNDFDSGVLTQPNNLNN